MKSWLYIFTLIIPAVVFVPPAQAEEKTRLIIMADMGNEPDEEQQITHMLMYSNMFDLEGLIACSGTHLHSGRREAARRKVYPELFHKLVNGYSQVVENLKKHAGGWPEPEYLRGIIKAGTAEYGIAAVEPGRSNEASQLIEAAILKDDPRKLYLVANAGTNTLAQALVDLDETRSDRQMAALCRKLIVYENGAQDNSGAWIARNYPEIAWHRSNHQTYGYGGSGRKHEANGPYAWEPYQRNSRGQHEWIEEHVMNHHGPLGACYPYRYNDGDHYIEGGGTCPWIGLANQGLSDPEHLYWGGWSGRFSREKVRNRYSGYRPIREDEKKYGDFYVYEAGHKQQETWTDPVHGETFTNGQVPVWRFRRAMFNDFRARMDWCVKPYGEANHNPVAAFNGDTSDSIVHLQVNPGQQIRLDASESTDPDGDNLIAKWWYYREAGTYDGERSISDASEKMAEMFVPEDAAGSTIHVILEVRDDSEIVSMYDYRRVVVTVADTPSSNKEETSCSTSITCRVTFDLRRTDREM